MFAKPLLFSSLAALLLAGAPAISHAQSGAEWLLHQEEITDGYAAPAATPKAKASKESPFQGTSLNGKRDRSAAPSYNSGGFQFRDGRVFLPNGQEISAP